MHAAAALPVFSVSVPSMHQIDHQHARSAADFGTAFLIGITLNIGFVIIEAACGWYFNSVSLLADAGHNLGDVLGLLLAYGSFRLARMRPSSRFTYGLGSSTILASAINGAILLIAVGYIVAEAIGRFGQQVSIDGLAIIWVAGAGVIVNLVTAMLFYRGRKFDLNVRGAWLHMMADALVSIGVMVSGALIMWTGFSWVDPVTSLIVAVIILVSTWSLFRDALMMLSHGVPVNIDLPQVRDYLEQLPHVEAVHDLHVWALSTTRTALTVHLVRPHDIPPDNLLIEVVRELHDRFGIDHSTIQIETPGQGQECMAIEESRCS